MTDKWYFAAGMLVVLIVAAVLRVGAVTGTSVDNPLRADARIYFANAYNLRFHGVLSDSLKDFTGEGEIRPSAKVPPGYPLFLSLFVNAKPDQAMLGRIGMAQAGLSILCVLLVGILGLRLLGPWPALAAALLTAISPHLVNYNVYVLTESLFALLLLGGIMLLALVGESDVGRRRLVLLVAAASVLGVAALTRSALYVFVIPAALLVWWTFRGKGGLLNGAAFAIIFVLLLSPWFIRNAIMIEDGSSSVVMNASLQHGMYPGFMYENKAESFGFPYRFDPRTEEYRRSLPAIVTEIGRRFSEEPMQHLGWYLLGKPVTFWQWSTIQGAGEIVVYPVLKSPYAQPGFHHITYLLSKLLHWPLVILAAFMSVFVFTPYARRDLDPHVLYGLRVVALVPVYFTALHMVLAPFPRYSVPLRPEMYLLASAGAWLAFKWWKKNASQYDA